VLRTRVGYAGGTSAHPSYERIGDHSESVEIVYATALLSYERLLELFWDSHDPTQMPYSRQYASLILYRSDEQRLLAERSKIEEQGRRGRPVHTEIRPAGPFTPAELYHQKFYLQNAGELLRSFREILPEEQALLHSTRAARLNALAAGLHSPGDLRAELPIFGLQPEQEELLLAAVGRR